MVDGILVVTNQNALQLPILASRFGTRDKPNSISYLEPPKPHFRKNPSLLSIFFEPHSEISPSCLVTKPIERGSNLHAAFPQTVLHAVKRGFLRSIVAGRTA